MGTRKIGFDMLLQAVYTRLTTDGLTSGYKVYNFVPPNTSFPYISFGSAIGGRSASLGATDIEGEDNVFHVHVWSDYKGDEQVNQYLDNICQALTGSALTITGYTPVLFLLDFTDVIVDDTEPAKLIRHGVARFRVWMA